MRCIDFERALFSLPPKMQALLVLRFREGQRQADIAEITASSDRAIGYQLPRALAVLALELDKRNLL